MVCQLIRSLLNLHKAAGILNKLSNPTEQTFQIHFLGVRYPPETFQYSLYDFRTIFKIKEVGTILYTYS